MLSESLSLRGSYVGHNGEEDACEVGWMEPEGLILEVSMASPLFAVGVWVTYTRVRLCPEQTLFGSGVLAGSLMGHLKLAASGFWGSNVGMLLGGWRDCRGCI